MYGVHRTSKKISDQHEKIFLKEYFAVQNHKKCSILYLGKKRAFSSKREFVFTGLTKIVRLFRPIVQREELQKEFDCYVTRISNGNQIMQQGNV